MRRAVILRIMGFLFIFGGPFIARYLDEEHDMQRWLKTLCMMLIPIGFSTIMISFFVTD